MKAGRLFRRCLLWTTAGTLGLASPGRDEVYEFEY